MEEDQARTGQGPPLGRPQAGRVIRVDEESHAVLNAYRRCLQEREYGRVTMARAVRELLLELAKEQMREGR